MKNLVNIVIDFLKQRLLRIINSLNNKNINRNKWILSLITLIVVLFILIFAFKGSLAKKVISDKVTAIEKEFEIKIILENIELKGFNTILIGKTIIITNPDTLLVTKNQLVKFSFFSALKKEINVKEVKTGDVYIKIIQNKGNRNYIINKRKKGNSDQTKKAEHQDPGKLIDNAFKLLFGLLPSKLSIGDVVIVSNLGDGFSMNCKGFNVKKNQFATIVDLNYKTKCKFLVKGNIDHRKKIIGLQSWLKSGNFETIPLIDSKLKTLLSFKYAEIVLSNDLNSESKKKYSGKLQFKGMNFFNTRFSLNMISLDSFSLDFILNSDKEYLELDSTSYLAVNSFRLYPYLRIDRKTQKNIHLVLQTGRFQASSLVSSIPEGYLMNLKGFKATGDLSYRMEIIADLNIPDSLKMYSKLERFNFNVKSFGSLNFSKLNSEFEYIAYKNGEPVATFFVGESNPFYRKLDKIHPYLKSAVLYSEDGWFYFHRGFIADAIRSSIVANIKAKRFARGGSTITMQLVKNIYLSSNKTLSRKIEEIIITWLIENYSLVSKDRMLEIYMNIIEWGPGIYGAGEASRFYFNKDVNELSLSEAIFMASIIPRPSKVKYAFDKDGHLRDYFSGHYKLVSGRMLKKELISQEQFDNLIPDVNLKGEARNLIIEKDTSKVDSAMFKDIFIEFPGQK